MPKALQTTLSGVNSLRHFMEEPTRPAADKSQPQVMHFQQTLHKLKNNKKKLKNNIRTHYIWLILCLLIIYTFP